MESYVIPLNEVQPKNVRSRNSRSKVRSHPPFPNHHSVRKEGRKEARESTLLKSFAVEEFFEVTCTCTGVCIWRGTFALSFQRIDDIGNWIRACMCMSKSGFPRRSCYCPKLLLRQTTIFPFQNTFRWLFSYFKVFLFC